MMWDSFSLVPVVLASRVRNRTCGFLQVEAPLGCRELGRHGESALGRLASSKQEIDGEDRLKMGASYFVQGLTDWSISSTFRSRALELKFFKIVIYTKSNIYTDILLYGLRR